MLYFGIAAKSQKVITLLDYNEVPEVHEVFLMMDGDTKINPLYPCNPENHIHSTKQEQISTEDNLNETRK